MRGSATTFASCSDSRAPASTTRCRSRPISRSRPDRSLLGHRFVVGSRGLLLLGGFRLLVGGVGGLVGPGRLVGLDWLVGLGWLVGLFALGWLRLDCVVTLGVLAIGGRVDVLGRGLGLGLLLRREQPELDAPVLFGAFLGVVVGDRLVWPVADGADP